MGDGSAVFAQVADEGMALWQPEVRRRFWEQAKASAGNANRKARPAAKRAASCCRVAARGRRSAVVSSERTGNGWARPGWGRRARAACCPCEVADAPFGLARVFQGSGAGHRRHSAMHRKGAQPGIEVLAAPIGAPNGGPEVVQVQGLAGPAKPAEDVLQAPNRGLGGLLGDRPAASIARTAQDRAQLPWLAVPPLPVKDRSASAEVHRQTLRAAEPPRHTRSGSALETTAEALERLVGTLQVHLLPKGLLDPLG
jgi:hypothetical protein